MDEQHLEEALHDLIGLDPDSLRDALANVLAADPELHVMDDDVPAVQAVRSFEAAGVLTLNRGLVLEFDNGDEFQLTLVRSR